MGGWATTGSQSGTASGWADSSFSGSSPFASGGENTDYGWTQGTFLSGIASGSGSDWRRKR